MSSSGLAWNSAICRPAVSASNPNTSTLTTAAAGLTGYRVVHTLTVTYRDLDTVGTAIDAVSDAGGDELAFRSIAFAHANPGRYLEAARREAVAELHRTATQLAEAANRVGPPDGPYLMPSAGAALLKAETVETPISIGTDSITVTVRGWFAIH